LPKWRFLHRYRDGQTANNGYKQNAGFAQCKIANKNEGMLNKVVMRCQGGLLFRSPLQPGTITPTYFFVPFRGIHPQPQGSLVSFLVFGSALVCLILVAKQLTSLL